MRPMLNQLFNTFYGYREHWSNALNCVAELDALVSLAQFSDQPGFVRPSVVNSEKAFLCVKDLRHPYLSLRPNSVSLPESMLITGANMGGKSTLLKSVCHSVILAQIGAFVPCKSYKATPFQKLCTRLGAYDSILEAKSTF